MDARVVGIRAEFTANSPWAYSDTKTVIMKINDTTEFKIDNNSDDLDSCVYPKVTFKNNQNNASLSIKNNTIGISTEFKQLQENEIITIDNNFVAYSDNTARIFNDDFNFVFPALSSGINSFNAEGNGELTIKFRYPMKIADSLLNDYEAKNKMVIYVDDNVVKIRGNVNLNPPIGVNIKVVNETMIIRGDLKKYVKRVANDDAETNR